MAIVTATVDQRQHRTPHLMNVQLVVGLVAIERERRELKERIAALAAQLKRDER
jgi:hypothetical protein